MAPGLSSRFATGALGQWAYPILLSILDDHSRLRCHAQWYLSEGAQELCHGLSQALQKRALPRALMSDNGSAMVAAETVQGLARLSIVHETTLPLSPYQKEFVSYCTLSVRSKTMVEPEAFADAV